MGFSEKKAERIQNRFIKKYWRGEYAKYINGCGISTVGLQNKKAARSEKDDLCLSVSLRKPLPKKLRLPEKFENIKVFVSVVSEIRPL